MWLTHLKAIDEAVEGLERLSRLDGSVFAHDVKGLMEGLVAEFPNNDRILNPNVSVVVFAVQAVAMTCKMLSAEVELRKRAEAAEADFAEAVDGIDAALNMVNGDGLPPNWDWLRQIKAAFLAKHGASR
jgi:hypothetical protein